jgi:hypothetical protein
VNSIRFLFVVGVLLASSTAHAHPICLEPDGVRGTQLRFSGERKAAPGAEAPGSATCVSTLYRAQAKGVTALPLPAKAAPNK